MWVGMKATAKYKDISLTGQYHYRSTAAEVKIRGERSKTKPDSMAEL